MLRELVVVLALTAVAMASEVFAPLEPKPYKFRNEEGCYVEVLGAVIPFGERATDACSCTEYRCTKDGMMVVKCSVIETSPPCQLVEDHSKPYPGCCANIVCPRYRS